MTGSSPSDSRAIASARVPVEDRDRTDRINPTDRTNPTDRRER